MKDQKLTGLFVEAYLNKDDQVKALEEENKRLRSALTAIAMDNLKWGQSVFKSREKLQKIAAAALEDK